MNGIAILALCSALAGLGQALELSRGVNFETLWHGYAPAWTDEALIRRDFARFRQDGIRHIAIQLYWYRLEGPTRGDYSGTQWGQEIYGDNFLRGVKRTIEIAHEYDLQVMVGFHTLWGESDSRWCTPAYVRAFREDPQTHEYAEEPGEHGCGLSIIRDRTGETEAAFVAAVTHAVDALRGADGIWSWALMNEPWAWPKTDWKRERFIGLIEKLAALVHERDPRPVTVRFVNAKVWDDAQGARHVTDIFYDDFRSDPRLFAALDFVSFNCYDGFPHETPDEQRVRREVLDILAQHVALCRQHGRDVWVTEFGLDTDDDAQQAQYAREMLAEFQRLGINGCLWWAWHGDWGGRDVKGSACGSYNLVADPLTGRPRPAYEVLANARP